MAVACFCGMWLSPAIALKKFERYAIVSITRIYPGAHHDR